MADAKEVNFELVGLMGEYLQELINKDENALKHLRGTRKSLFAAEWKAKKSQQARYKHEKVSQEDVLFQKTHQAQVTAVDANLGSEEMLLCRHTYLLECFTAGEYEPITEAFRYLVDADATVKITVGAKSAFLLDCLIALRDASGQK